MIEACDCVVGTTVSDDDDTGIAGIQEGAVRSWFKGARDRSGIDECKADGLKYEDAVIGRDCSKFRC